MRLAPGAAVLRIVPENSPPAAGLGDPGPVSGSEWSLNWLVLWQPLLSHPAARSDWDGAAGCARRSGLPEGAGQPGQRCRSIC